MRTVFGDMVKARMDAKDLKQRGLADAVGLAHSSVNKILNNSYAVPPPLGEDLKRWIEVLEIPEDQHERFELMAACGHMPEIVRPTFEALVDKHLQLERDYAELVAQLSAIKRAAEK